MIYALSGKISAKEKTFAALDVHGVSFKVHMTERDLSRLPAVGHDVHLFSHLHVREDALDLYGFLGAEELRLFELLISVSGVGPKSALSILDIAELKELSAAISEGRPDLLTKASGIGRKTGERIILDLKNKVVSEKSEAIVKKMESDSDLVEMLVSLGYRREQARAALGKIGEEVVHLEERLKKALKVLSGK